ncbi:23217_t:CDS:2 [Gigaspora margarita]|uniref:23217_t:CDS:1 n=1 Tax=Gigaspora margarita TaxID=4874 RepID=A0ABN7V6M2_GIGMA|nr:23217_t:CDS:2 [Gigaspora margarita]
MNLLVDQQPEPPIGLTWEDKVNYICNQINLEQTGQAAQLPYYFSLGALIEVKASNQKAKQISEAQAITHQEIEEIQELTNLTGAR